MSTKIYMLENLGCAHCAAKMEEKIGELSGVTEATITFATKQLRVTAEEPDAYLEEIRKICSSIESQVKVEPRDIKVREAAKTENPKETKKELGDLPIIIVGAILFLIGNVLNHLHMDAAGLVIFVAAYLILGGKFFWKLAETFLMDRFLMKIFSCALQPSEHL